MWLTLRVAQQVIFERSFPAPQGRIIYKNFMLYLLASFDCRESHHKGSEVHVDHLAIIRAKVGRHSYKIQGCMFAFVDDYGHATMNGHGDDLKSIQKGVIDSDIIAIPHNPHSASSHDGRISLDSSTKYMRDAISYSPPKPWGKDFNSTHKRCKRSGDLGLPTFQDGSLTSLADVENGLPRSWLVGFKD
ncbi:hypothetical protein NUU61_001563 [Penicillium alfredii]|uniref:Uncharacterized protein n=1 Tax=Penicillium alfredii TaxID=1506179 RepID=A0A9W9G4R5_9EURO|nr:uncharacterized protein NUU61_001563 [Penicillium alfredii]KAJ5111933.1 hypothetical protein NUU61_001563 [Penicillium alfredii]